MKCSTYMAVVLLAFAAGITAAEVTTIKADVDTSACSHLMLDPIPQERIEVSKKALQQGDEPVLVQLTNNAIFNVNKPKMVKELVGHLAEATGELKVKDGQIRLQSAKPIEAASIPADESCRPYGAAPAAK